MSINASTLDLSSLYPIRVATTLRGVQGFAIHAFNRHSQTWQPVGQIHTGPNAWADVHRSRVELIEEVVQLALEGQRA